MRGIYTRGRPPAMSSAPAVARSGERRYARTMSSRALCIAALAVALSGCHRRRAAPKGPLAPLGVTADRAAARGPAPAEGSASATPENATAEDPAAPAGEAPPRRSEGEAAPSLPPGEAASDLPAAPPPKPPDGPPADGVAAVLHSLLPDALVAAPDPASLPFYDIDVRIEPSTGALSGEVRIDWPNGTGARLTSLPLRVFANADDPLLSLKAARPGDPAPVRSADAPSLYELPLSAPVAPGGWAHLAIAFSGRAPAPDASPVDEGALLSSLLSAPGRAPDYGLFSRFRGGVALAEWLPVVAGRWNGHFDRDPTAPLGDNSYLDVSSFRARVDLPADETLAAPGVLLGEELHADRRISTVALADARDFPLFASRSYRVAEGSVGSVRVRSVYLEGDGDAGRSVLATARAALADFSRSFHPYPYATFSAVEVPLRGGAGGAEFPGLVAVAGMAYGRGGALPMGLSFSGPYLAELREFVVAHEVAHQWWACAIGSQPRRQPDVDEPLAQFSAALYVGHARGDAARRAVLGSQVAVNYQAMRMLGAADGPVARSTSDFSNAAEYAGLVYGKAPFFYDEALRRCGEASLLRGLSSYADAHWLGLARRGDAAAAIARACPGGGREIQDLFGRYFKESHGDEDLAGRADLEKIALEAFGGGGNLDLSSLLGGGGAGGGGALLNALGAQGGGGQAAGAMPPQAQQLLQQLSDPKQAQQLLQQLNGMMGGGAEGQ